MKGYYGQGRSQAFSSYAVHNAEPLAGVLDETPPIIFLVNQPVLDDKEFRKRAKDGPTPTQAEQNAFAICLYDMILQ